VGVPRQTVAQHNALEWRRKGIREQKAQRLPYSRGFRLLRKGHAHRCLFVLNVVPAPISQMIKSAWHFVRASVRRNTTQPYSGLIALTAFVFPLAHGSRF
jgi:hypothetical protein